MIYIVSTNSKKNKPKGHLSKDKDVVGSVIDTSMDDASMKKKAPNSKVSPQKKK